MRRAGAAIVIGLWLAVLAASGVGGLAVWIDPALAIGLAITLLVLALD
jgi:hypothetical protein